MGPDFALGNEVIMAPIVTTRIKDQTPRTGPPADTDLFPVETPAGITGRLTWAQMKAGVPVPEGAAGLVLTGNGMGTPATFQPPAGGGGGFIPTHYIWIDPGKPAQAGVNFTTSAAAAAYIQAQATAGQTWCVTIVGSVGASESFQVTTDITLIIRGDNGASQIRGAWEMSHPSSTLYLEAVKIAADASVTARGYLYMVNCSDVQGSTYWTADLKTASIYGSNPIIRITGDENELTVRGSRAVVYVDGADNSVIVDWAGVNGEQTAGSTGTSFDIKWADLVFNANNAAGLTINVYAGCPPPYITNQNSTTWNYQMRMIADDPSEDQDVVTKVWAINNLKTYTPVVPTDWDGDPPTTAGAALDRLAAAWNILTGLPVPELGN